MRQGIHPGAKLMIDDSVFGMNNTIVARSFFITNPAIQLVPQ